VVRPPSLRAVFAHTALLSEREELPRLKGSIEALLASNFPAAPPVSAGASQKCSKTGRVGGAEAFHRLAHPDNKGDLRGALVRRLVNSGGRHSGPGAIPALSVGIWAAEKAEGSGSLQPDRSAGRLSGDGISRCLPSAGSRPVVQGVTSKSVSPAATVAPSTATTWRNATFRVSQGNSLAVRR